MHSQVDQIRISAIKLATICLKSSQLPDYETLYLFHSFFICRLKFLIQNENCVDHQTLIDLMDTMYSQITNAAVNDNGKFKGIDVSEIANVISLIFQNTTSAEVASAWTRFLCTYCEYFEASNLLDAPCCTLLDRIEFATLKKSLHHDLVVSDVFTELILLLAKIVGSSMDCSRSRNGGNIVNNEPQAKTRTRLSLFGSLKEESSFESSTVASLSRYIPRLLSAVGVLISDATFDSFGTLFVKIVSELGSRNWHVILLSIINYVELQIEINGDEVFLISMPLKLAVTHLCKQFRDDIFKELLSILQYIRESKLEFYQRM